jgi:hypothetical protein
MKFILVLMLLCIQYLSFSQKTERYNGDFYNGIKIKGSASYSYYDNADQKKVKHGSFRYSAREKTDTWRYSHGISGNYNHGLKDGKWVYALTSKDYEKDQKGYFYYYEVQLTSNYKDGLPEGRWKYTSKISKYKITTEQGRLKNGVPEIIEDIDITLHWKKGILVDSIIIIDSLNQIIKISMNSEGFLHGSYAVEKNGNLSEIEYEQGILMHNTDHGITTKNPEYLSYKTLKNPTESVSKQKNSLLDDTKNVISKYIEKQIFNNNYFLYRYIDGDNLLQRKGEFGDYQVKLDGLFYFQLSPILNPTEASIINTITGQYERAKEAERDLTLKLKSKPKDEALLKSKSELNHIISAFNKINCHIQTYQQYLSLDFVLKNGKSKCSALTNAGALKTRLDYLNVLKTQADEQAKRLNTFLKK